MAWLVLLVSGVLEAVWAIALGRSEGFTRLAPSLVFLVGIVLSMGGLDGLPPAIASTRTEHCVIKATLDHGGPHN